MDKTVATFATELDRIIQRQLKEAADVFVSGTGLPRISFVLTGVNIWSLHLATISPSAAADFFRSIAETIEADAANQTDARNAAVKRMQDSMVVLALTNYAMDGDL